MNSDLGLKENVTSIMKKERKQQQQRAALGRNEFFE